MKKSLLVNQDVFINETSLTDVFNKYILLPDVDLGYIRNQNVFSNDKKDMLFFYSFNDVVLKQFNEFCKNFGFAKIGEYVFFSFPGCGCNNPKTIYVRKPIDIDYMLGKKNFIKWFELKENNMGHFNMMDWARLKETDNIHESVINNVFQDRNVYYDKSNYYAPFNICDKLIYGSGCSSPSDIGYIAHKK